MASYGQGSVDFTSKTGGGLSRFSYVWEKLQRLEMHLREKDRGQVPGSVQKEGGCEVCSQVRGEEEHEER